MQLILHCYFANYQRQYLATMSKPWLHSKTKFHRVCIEQTGVSQSKLTQICCHFAKQCLPVCNSNRSFSWRSIMQVQNCCGCYSLLSLNVKNTALSNLGKNCKQNISNKESLHSMSSESLSKIINSMNTNYAIPNIHVPETTSSQGGIIPMSLVSKKEKQVFFTVIVVTISLCINHN